MSAGSYDIEIEKGATFQLTLTWKDEDGNAIDLTGFTARMQIRAKKSSEDPIVELTTENGGITLGDEEGTIALEIDAETTEDIEQNSGVYDLELVSSGDIVTRLLEGRVTFDPEVTR